MILGSDVGYQRPKSLKRRRGKRRVLRTERFSSLVQSPSSRQTQSFCERGGWPTTLGLYKSKVGVYFCT